MESEIFYKRMQLPCGDDGLTRTIHVKCYRFDGSFACDTFFSVPAHTRVRGKYVHGYVTGDDSGSRFVAYNRCKRAFEALPLIRGPNPKFSAKEGYHRWPGGIGSFEVFWCDGAGLAVHEGDEPEEATPGWYWWACFPGCPPDGDASGPFNSSTAAWKDARNA